MDVGIAGACDTRSMDTILGITSSFMMTVCAWTTITRKGPRERPNNFLWVLVAKGDASLFSVAESDGLTTNTKSRCLNARV